MLRGLVLLCALISLCVMFSCAGGGVRPNSPQNTNTPVNLSMPPKADVVAGRTVSWDETGAPDFMKWDMIFGQQYPLGTAEIVLDGGVYYMKYTLTQAAIDAGWRYIDAAVNIWDPTDPPAKLDVPGQYPYKWSVTGYDAGLTEVLLPLGSWTPTEDFPIAIHASLWQPTYDAYGVPTGYNKQTGWGGLWWATKAGKSEGAYWTENWKKWGGYMEYSDTKDLVLPQFAPFEMWFHALYNYSLNSYWRLEFTTDPPAADQFPFTWDYYQDGIYTRGWCVDPQYLSNNMLDKATIYSCYDPELPAYAKDQDWDIISYMIDQRYGGAAGNIYFDASVNTFQKAIWYFKYGNYWVDFNGGHDTRLGGFDAATQALVNDAKAHGENYVPGPGDWFAGVVWPESDGNDYKGKYGKNPAGNDNTYYQMLIVGIDP